MYGVKDFKGASIKRSCIRGKNETLSGRTKIKFVIG